MRLVRRLLLAAIALAVLASAALALWLPRYVASPAFDARLRRAISSAIGREVAWGGLSVGLIPPRLIASKARVGAPEAPALEAERIELRLALLPLLARAVVVDSLALDGLSLHLVRSPAGIEWGGAAEATPAPAAAATPPRDGEPKHAGSDVSLAVRSVRVASSSVALTDRTVAPPATLGLTEVAATVRGTGPDAPLDLELAAHVAAGGELRGEGRLEPGGPLDVTLTLDGVGLAPFAPWLGASLHLGGRASGQLRARGPWRAPEQLDADLRVGDADVRVGEVGVKGPIAARAALLHAQGTFSIDATGAELVYGGAFHKPPGAPATAEGRLAAQPDGKIGVDAVKLSIKNMGGEGRLAPGSAVQLALDDPAWLEGDLEGLLARPERPLAGARGRVAFATGRGRFPGVSPLRLAFESLGRIRAAAEVVASSERKLEPFEGDRFDALGGSFRVGDGLARTDDFALRYPGYALGLRGSIGLDDERLAMVGTLSLSESLLAALGADAKGGRALPLARIGGTVSDPKVEVEEEAAVAFAATLALGAKRGKLERKLDQQLGEGSGKQILDALGGLLQRSQPKERP